MIDDVVTVDFLDALQTLRRVRDGKDGVRVRVIDELEGQDRVENGLHRWGGRTGARHLRRQLVHHLRIG